MGRDGDHDHRGDRHVRDDYRGSVVIRDAHGRRWGRAQARLASDGRSLVGEITAPLWMVSLSGGMAVRLDDGSSGTLRVREIRAMDGPVATVHVEIDVTVDEGSSPDGGQGDPAGVTRTISSRT